MKIICKVEGAECPKNLNICCGTCEDRETCSQCCDMVYSGIPDEYQAEVCAACLDAEVVNDEVMSFESSVPDTLQRMTTLIRLKKEVEEQEKQLKDQLVKAMEAYGIKAFENDVIKLMYVAPTTRSSIDTTRLKKEHPDIAEAYAKTTAVSASVRITVK